MRRYAVLLLRLAAMPLTTLADWLEEPDPRLWADDAAMALWFNSRGRHEPS